MKIKAVWGKTVLGEIGMKAGGVKKNLTTECPSQRVKQNLAPQVDSQETAE